MGTSKKTKYFNYNIPIHFFFITICLFLYIMPLLLIVSISFSDEKALLESGYQFIPKKISLTAYKYVLNNLEQILISYKVTALQSVAGTFLAVLVMALCAYPLSRRSFTYRKPITIYIFFTMLFGGGIIPSYILNTKYLLLGNKIWIYILPAMAHAFYIIIFRTFFQGLPISLVESAKIDGASEIRIFFRIVLPQSKPVLATISLIFLLDRWNDWFTCLIYVRKQELYTLQYLLQKILAEAEFISKLTLEAPAGISMSNFDIPTESIRFAMCIIAAGPMLMIFPFFQKYFTKGLVVGAIKE